MEIYWICLNCVNHSQEEEIAIESLQSTLDTLLNKVVMT